MNAQDLVVLAIVGFFGQTLAVVVGQYLTQRNARRAQQAAQDAKLATMKAAEDANKAQAQAAAQIRQAIAAAQQNSEHLGAIRNIAENTKVATDDIQVKVNGQHTALLRLVADLRRKVAEDNPSDEAAQGAYRVAEEAAVAAERERDK